MDIQLGELYTQWAAGEPAVQSTQGKDHQVNAYGSKLKADVPKISGLTLAVLYAERLMECPQVPVRDDISRSDAEAFSEGIRLRSAELLRVADFIDGHLPEK